MTDDDLAPGHRTATGWPSTVGATRIRPAALDHREGWQERAGRDRVWDSFWSAWDAFAGAASYEEMGSTSVYEVVHGCEAAGSPSCATIARESSA